MEVDLEDDSLMDDATHDDAMSLSPRKSSFDTSLSTAVTTKAHGRPFTPWIEKYRPGSIDEVAHQKHVTSVLKRACESANLPHLLFYGPPGTGKTSCILALARDLFPRALLKNRVLELNASDERGIDVIRSKVKQFAQFTVSNQISMKKKKSDSLSKSSMDSNGPISVPPFKLIILDEADSMTRDAQTALRRTMEKFSSVTRFCLICNYVSRIIAPVASRCAKFRFEPLTESSMKLKLSEIASLENLTLSQDVSSSSTSSSSEDSKNEDTLTEIIEHSNGDMRKAITLLQSAALLASEDGKVTAEDVREVSVSVPRSIIMDALRLCRTSSYERVIRAAQDIVRDGYPADLVLSKLLDCVMDCTELSNTAKANIAIRMGEADRKLVDGASEMLQLTDVFCYVATQSSVK